MDLGRPMSFEMTALRKGFILAMSTWASVELRWLFSKFRMGEIMSWTEGTSGSKQIAQCLLAKRTTSWYCS